MVKQLLEVEHALHNVVHQNSWEFRDGQSLMVKAVYNALADSQHLLVQAGTGTGKTLGYLIPAMIYSVQSETKTVISTATLQLQRQIMKHDVPLALAGMENILDKTPKVALLKGWNNYVCLQKVNGGYPQEDELFSNAEAKYGVTATGEEVLRARDWALETETGDRDDLVPGVSERVWNQVSVSSYECIGNKCPFRSECFPVQASKVAEDANVIVTNHAFLGIKAAGGPVLDSVENYIVDEAHELIDRVTSQLTLSLNKYDISVFSRNLTHANLPSVDLANSVDEIDRILSDIDEGRILTVSADLQDALMRLVGRVQEASEYIAGLSDADEQQLAIKNTLQAKANSLLEVSSAIIDYQATRGNEVLWKTVYRDAESSLHLAALDVSKKIAENLFAENPAILTSATLKIGNSFAPIARRVGFSVDEQSSFSELDVGSPFNHNEQGILYIAKHLPPPNKDGYGEEHLRLMQELLEAAGGGALCLFTSRVGAERAADFMREHSTLPILCQGEDQLPTLIQEFAQDEQASLFGTLSLWQGVDVPGITNRLVIIDRIPFPRPNDPLIQARNEIVRARGGNDFMEVSVAQAALLLAQGAGRLLRTTEDRGVVAILDSRLATARYGKILLSAVPHMWPTIDTEVVKEILGRLNPNTK